MPADGKTTMTFNVESVDMPHKDITDESQKVKIVMDDFDYDEYGHQLIDTMKMFVEMGFSVKTKSKDGDLTLTLEK